MPPDAPVTSTPFPESPVSTRASVCSLQRLASRRARSHHQRHGGRLRDRQAGADERRRPDVRGGPQALHRGDQRGRPRRQGGRRDRDRRHGLPRRRRRLDVQLARAGAAARGLRVGRAGGVDGLHGVPRAGLRRRALRRHARDGRDAGREHEPHRLRPRLPAALVQRHRGGRDGDQRGALRHLGLPGAARHRRRGVLPRREGAARRRPHDRRGQAGVRLGRGAADPAGAGAEADRGRARRRRSAT